MSTTRTIRGLLLAVIIIGCGPHGSRGGIRPMIVLPRSPDVLAILQKQNPGVDPTLLNDFLDVGGYHDAQKLPPGQNATDYGPMVHLYSTFMAPDADAFKVTNGAFVGVVQVDDDSDKLTAYERLGIDAKGPGPHVYCVYLWLKNEAADNWEASIRPETGGVCASADPKYRLDARPTHEANAISTDSVPTAARFGEDQAGFPTIGFTCLLNWCEMGRALGPSVGRITAGKSVQSRVNAWNDDQKVSEKKSTGPLVRSTRAAISPVPGLQDKKLAAFETKLGGGLIGTLVASIVVDGTVPEGNFRLWGLVPHDTTDLWIRHDVGTDDWSALFIPHFGIPDPAAAWVKVDRKSHAHAKVPGMARWMWNEDDEGIWVGCEQGCCELGGVTKGLPDNSYAALMHSGTKRKR